MSLLRPGVIEQHKRNQIQILAMLLCLLQMHVTFPVVKAYIALIPSNV